MMLAYTGNKKWRLVAYKEGRVQSAVEIKGIFKHHSCLRREYWMWI